MEKHRTSTKCKWSTKCLVTPLLNKGYHLFFDNFYTSPKLIKDLFEQQTPSCGTVAENRKGFPECMKGKKEWTDRQTVCLIQQWKDNKPVTTIHSANEFGMVERKVKLNDRWDKVEVRRPKAIDTYNQYMNGVNRSDQILAKNNTLSTVYYST